MYAVVSNVLYARVLWYGYGYYYNVYAAVSYSGYNYGYMLHDTAVSDTCVLY